jgi:hypothetical protein
MGVDNATVKGMDFSDLLAVEPDLWMLYWTDGKGEIERIALDDSNNASNLNGLREDFYDVTPYVALFQQFLTLITAKDLLLDQAKKVQIDLINQLFESKRQLPFHYPVAAGDYWWNATDSSLFSSTAGGLQNAVAKLNEIIAAINWLVPTINGLDASICSQVNANVADRGNGLISQLQTMETEIDGSIVGPTNAALDYQNYWWIEGSGNTINSQLQTGGIPDPPNPSIYVAMPGLTGDLPATTQRLANLVTVLNSTFIHIDLGAGMSWTPIGNVSPANAQWIPIGSTTPVTVTPDEQAAILSGIAERTNALFIIKNQKIGEVNALTTIDDVIAYDVLASWPDIPVPPGYKLEAPTSATSSVSIIGTPPAPAGGIPEAPSDDVTYGRRNMVWNPALALSGDVLDGGNF